MPETPIPPALTPEEWQLAADGGMCADCYAQNYRIVRTVDDDETPVPLADVVYPKDVSRHALAALCLHGQPYGFTHEDLERLAHWRHGGIDFGHLEWADSLFDRLAALLPPRP